MKLYLSSYRIPTPDDVAELIGKPLNKATVALIPNAKDYYSQRAWNCKLDEMVIYLQDLGLKVDVVDLREFNDATTLKAALADHDLVWARGGNAFVLRYEMHRSGFDDAIRELLDEGVVYGGDSAGALVAGVSLAGTEDVEEPEFADEVIEDGMALVPFTVLPHIDNPEFAAVLPVFRERHKDEQGIELKDCQAVIFDGDSHRIVNGVGIPAAPEERLSQDELAARLQKAAAQVTVGARYKHYKQLTYTVLNIALREEDNEPCVVYQAEYGERVVFIRPVANWLETVEVDGKSVERFTKIAS